jgi:hypothetical protein
MKPFRTCLILLAASALLSTTARGQGPMPNAGPPGWNAAMTKLFGDVKAFTAKADTRMLDKSGQETMSLAGMNFALLDEKVRVEVDMTQMKSAQMPAGAMDGLKQMGMDRVISIVQTEKKNVCLVYPGLEACVDMPIPEEAGGTDLKDFKLETTKVGNETLDGQACVKNQVIITDAKGQKREAFVWNAAALKDFPIQIQLTEGDNTVVMRYRDIQFAKPDAKQFEIPAGYARYASIQEFMQKAMMKMMGGAAGGNP